MFENFTARMYNSEYDGEQVSTQKSEHSDPSIYYIDRHHIYTPPPVTQYILCGPPPFEHVKISFSTPFKIFY